MSNGGAAEIADGDTIDTSEVDAIAADEIVQYALFGDVIYG